MNFETIYLQKYPKRAQQIEQCGKSGLFRENISNRRKLIEHSSRHVNDPKAFMNRFYNPFQLFIVQIESEMRRKNMSVNPPNPRPMITSPLPGNQSPNGIQHRNIECIMHANHFLRSRELSQVMDHLLGFLLQAIHHPSASHAKRFQCFDREAPLHIPIRSIGEHHSEPLVKGPHPKEESIWAAIKFVFRVHLPYRFQPRYDDDSIATKSETYDRSIAAGQLGPHQVIEFEMSYKI